MHLNRILKVLVTVNPEIRSVAMIVKRVLVPARLGSEEFIVDVFSPKVNQLGIGDTIQ